jgi:uncharacterized membrane protein
MKTTRLSLLFVLLTLFAIFGYLLTSLLVARGQPVIAVPANFVFTLAGISVVLILLSLPIWRYRKQLEDAKAPVKRVDPFYAVRVLLLAKATSTSGSIFLGVHLGILFWQMLNQGFFSSAMTNNLLGLMASFLMVASGLIAERICRVPDDGQDKGATA